MALTTGSSRQAIPAASRCRPFRLRLRRANLGFEPVGLILKAQVGDGAASGGLGCKKERQAESYLPRGLFGRTSISYDGSFSERMIGLLISFISFFGTITPVG